MQSSKSIRILFRTQQQGIGMSGRFSRVLQDDPGRLPERLLGKLLALRLSMRRNVVLEAAVRMVGVPLIDIRMGSKLTPGDGVILNSRNRGYRRGSGPDRSSTSADGSRRAMAAALCYAKVLLGPDSGPMHVAAAVGGSVWLLSLPTRCPETGSRMASSTRCSIDPPAAWAATWNPARWRAGAASHPSR
jgi:hypothetical protein